MHKSNIYIYINSEHTVSYDIYYTPLSTVYEIHSTTVFLYNVLLEMVTLPTLNSSAIHHHANNKCVNLLIKNDPSRLRW